MISRDNRSVLRPSTLSQIKTINKHSSVTAFVNDQMGRMAKYSQPFSPGRCLRSNSNKQKPDSSHAMTLEPDSSLLEIDSGTKNHDPSDAEGADEPVDWPSSHHSQETENKQPAPARTNAHQKEVHTTTTAATIICPDDSSNKGRSAYVKPFEKPARHRMREDRLPRKQRLAKSKEKAHKFSSNALEAVCAAISVPRTPSSKLSKPKVKAVVDLLANLEGVSATRLTLPAKSQAGIFKHGKQASDKASSGGSMDSLYNLNRSLNLLNAAKQHNELPDSTIEKIVKGPLNSSENEKHKDLRDVTGHGTAAALQDYIDKSQSTYSDASITVPEISAPRPTKTPLKSVLQLLDDRAMNPDQKTSSVNHNFTTTTANPLVSNELSRSEPGDSRSKLALEIQSLADAINTDHYSRLGQSSEALRFVESCLGLDPRGNGGASSPDLIYPGRGEMPTQTAITGEEFISIATGTYESHSPRQIHFDSDANSYKFRPSLRSAYDSRSYISDLFMEPASLYDMAYEANDTSSCCNATGSTVLRGGTELLADDVDMPDCIAVCGDSFDSRCDHHHDYQFYDMVGDKSYNRPVPLADSLYPSTLAPANADWRTYSFHEHDSEPFQPPKFRYNRLY